MNNSDSGMLRVYFDGACYLCSREISHYEKLDQGRRMIWVNIADPAFDVVKEGLNREAVDRVMHVKLPNGEIRTAVYAFAEIWKRLPQFERFAPLLVHPLIHPFLNVGYHIFARVRPYLPKKKQACEIKPR